MDVEQHSLVLPRCSIGDALRFRATSRVAAASLTAVMRELSLDGLGKCSDDAACKSMWDSVRRFLKAHPGVRRLSLRGARLSAEDLSGLIAQAPAVVDCDLTLALPMSWPSYADVQQRLRNNGVTVSDTLDVVPSPMLTPRDVVIVQAYGLHCRRIDVCFRFASPANRMATGPLERFARLFGPQTDFGVMLGSSSFVVTSEERCAPRGTAVVMTVLGSGGGGARQEFVWQLTQQGPGEYEGCWMTDSVVPLRVEALWDGSFLEE
mmetsp:Transcript_112927/g.326220  ORF Transcript_112927/g.326220 Transcript_112927/m.326220 type:complete len:264 (-) Transcript_112927:77-868(-)